MIPIIYYAHSLELYDTPREQEELARLKAYFSSRHGLIFNPNCESVQHSKSPMSTCLHLLKDPSITDLAFSHEAKKIPLGVFREIQLAQKYRKPVWIINPTGISRYLGKTKETKKDMTNNWAEV